MSSLRSMPSYSFPRYPRRGHVLFATGATRGSGADRTEVRRGGSKRGLMISWGVKREVRERLHDWFVAPIDRSTRSEHTITGYMRLCSSQPMLYCLPPCVAHAFSVRLMTEKFSGSKGGGSAYGRKSRSFTTLQLFYRAPAWNHRGDTPRTPCSSHPNQRDIVICMQTASCRQR